MCEKCRAGHWTLDPDRKTAPPPMVNYACGRTISVRLCVVCLTEWLESNAYRELEAEAASVDGLTHHHRHERCLDDAIHTWADVHRCNRAAAIVFLEWLAE